MQICQLVCDSPLQPLHGMHLKWHLKWQHFIFVSDPGFNLSRPSHVLQQCHSALRSPKEMLITAIVKRAPEQWLRDQIGQWLLYLNYRTCTLKLSAFPYFVFALNRFQTLLVKKKEHFPFWKVLFQGWRKLLHAALSQHHLLITVRFWSGWTFLF